MNAQFQSLFENVCRCFGHTPTSRAGGAFESSENNTGDNDANDQSRESITTVNSDASSVAGKRRTNKLKLNDKQYDELFDKVGHILPWRSNPKPSANSRPSSE